MEVTQNVAVVLGRGRALRLPDARKSLWFRIRSDATLGTTCPLSTTSFFVCFDSPTNWTDALARRKKGSPSQSRGASGWTVSRTRD